MNPIYLIITQRTILIHILLEYLNQGCNARKNFSEVYTSFVLQFTVSGRNVNTRQMSKPDMADPSFTYNNQWNILVIGNYYVNYQNSDTRILNEHWWLYSFLQIPPKENWFQCVRRVYTPANNFPCFTPLILTM